MFGAGLHGGTQCSLMGGVLTCALYFGWGWSWRAVRNGAQCSSDRGRGGTHSQSVGLRF